jgi:hypothetical protein
VNRRLRRRDRHPEVGEQRAHPRGDVVDDPPDRLEVLSLEVLDRPVLVPLAGEDGAGLTAAPVSTIAATERPELWMQA